MNAHDDTLTYSFPDKDPEKRLRELILYIADKCVEDPTFGKTKLNKILWFGDFSFYMLNGEPITGTEYSRLPYGAVPKGIDSLIKEMSAEKELIIKRTQVIDFQRKRPVALRKPEIDGYFTPSQISMIDEIISQFWGERAEDVSELSHNIVWKVFGMYDSIPYEAALLSDEPITIEDIERTKELAKEYGWELAGA